MDLVQNRKESLDFFAEAVSATKMCKKGQHIFFDLSSIITLSVESVMYLIAIIRNIKRIKAHNIICEGNSPKDHDARQLLVDSGFYNYVYCKHINPDSKGKDSIRITEGKRADGALAGQVCEFILQNSNKPRSATRRIYPLIVELMTNTRQHAYNNHFGTMEENWYIFAEDKKDYIQFVFLDTGAGIPYTIRKNFTERVAELFIRQDAKFIASALKGDFRTETKMEHRGKGMPEIYSISKEGIITDLTVFSGKGLCIVGTDGSIEESILATSFIGTLFSWKYAK